MTLFSYNKHLDGTVDEQIGTEKIGN